MSAASRHLQPQAGATVGDRRSLDLRGLLPPGPEQAPAAPGARPARADRPSARAPSPSSAIEIGGREMARRRIVLLGATGFTGNRVLRELLAAGEKPTLMGRNGTRMAAAAGRLGAELPVVEVDVTPVGDLERVFTA